MTSMTNKKIIFLKLYTKYPKIMLQIYVCRTERKGQRSALKCQVQDMKHSFKLQWLMNQMVINIILLTFQLT